MIDAMPPEAFLAAFSDGIREAAETLRGVVRSAVPESIERVRGGWRLIGYEVPVGRRSRFFAYIAPEPIHVHLGFEHGAWMADPEGLLEGAHLGLKKVRYTTFTAGQPIPTAALVALTREAARVSRLSRGERLALAFDREWEPEARPLVRSVVMGSPRTSDHRLDRLGERAFLLHVEAQARVHEIADALTDDLQAGRIEDVVPADRSLLLLFDGTDTGERAARRALGGAIERVRTADGLTTGSTPRHRLIPVAYGGGHGPDLDATASLAGVSPRELIELHTSREHPVLFLGFAPGFAYLGEVAPKIVVPRLATPRTATRAGSVALAEAYTGIYPASLPGGWRVIGWTPVVLFDPAADPPTYLAPGDTVRFESVAADDLPSAPYRPPDWAG